MEFTALYLITEEHLRMIIFMICKCFFGYWGDLVKENKIISTGKEKAGGRDHEENKWKRTGN
ncbi:hypothetical protein F120042H4_08110 [Faecalimonas umbilicata]